MALHEMMWLLLCACPFRVLYGGGISVKDLQ